MQKEKRKMSGNLGKLSAARLVLFVMVLAALQFFFIWCFRAPPSPEKIYLLELRFDSREKVFPHAFDFDNDWNPLNQSESYKSLSERLPPAVYYRVKHYEGFEVHQFAYYYAYNPFFNYHEHDLERAYVFVREGKPRILALSAHIWWNLYQVEDFSELTAFVERGGHAMWHEPIAPDRVSEQWYSGSSDRAGRVIKPSEFKVHSWEELERDELYSPGWTLTGENTYNFQTDEAGDFRKAGEPGGEVPRLSARADFLDPVIILKNSQNPSYWLGRIGIVE